MSSHKELIGAPIAPASIGGHMKYLGAWILGVPTGLIVLWFVFSHLH